MDTDRHLRPKRYVVSVREAAELLGMPKSSIYNNIKTGQHEFQLVRVGKRVLITRASLARLLETDDF